MRGYIASMFWCLNINIEEEIVTDAGQNSGRKKNWCLKKETIPSITPGHPNTTSGIDDWFMHIPQTSLILLEFSSSPSDKPSWLYCS